MHATQSSLVQIIDPIAREYAAFEESSPTIGLNAVQRIRHVHQSNTTHGEQSKSRQQHTSAYRLPTLAKSPPVCCLIGIYLKRGTRVQSESQACCALNSSIVFSIQYVELLSKSSVPAE